MSNGHRSDSHSTDSMLLLHTVSERIVKRLFGAVLECASLFPSHFVSSFAQPQATTLSFGGGDRTATPLTGLPGVTSVLALYALADKV